MNLFEIEHILLDIKVDSKETLFDLISEKLEKLHRITSKDSFKYALLNREKEISTAVGDGFAIPHAKDISVLFPTLLYIRLSSPLSYDAFDQKDVNHIFAIAMPNTYHKEHLALLSKIALFLLEEKNKKLINTSKDLNDLDLMIKNFLK